MMPMWDRGFSPERTPPPELAHLLTIASEGNDTATSSRRQVRSRRWAIENVVAIPRIVARCAAIE